MTSKEALEALIPIIELVESLYFTNEDAKARLIKGLYENIAIIENDLGVLDILNKKEVAIDELKNCIKNDSEDRPALEEYNAFAGDKNSLTQEKFNKIKGWIENEK